MRRNTNGVRLIVLWAVFASVICAPLVFGNHLRATRPYPLAYPIAVAAVAGLCWTALSTLLQRVVARVPFSRTRWAPAAVIHIVGLVASVKAHAGLFGLVARPFGLQDDIRLMASANDFATGMAIQLYVISVAVISILQSQTRAQRAEIALMEAERLSAGARSLALRSQLNAHFLFNALNTVAMAIRRSDRDGALSVVVGLGTLLRTALRRSTTELVPLKDEIDFVTHYLEIEQARFRDRLNVEWLVDADVHRAAVPALILQPVVENALRHGIEKRSDAGGLRIRASRSGDMLQLAVDDDGPGFGGSWVEGVGLANVRDRLAIHFSGAAELTVVDVERGASVRLSLPFSEVAADAEVPDAHRRR